MKDDGTAIGVDVGTDTLRSISQDIANSIEPEPISKLEVLEPRPGVTCISVFVEGNDRPYSKSGMYLIRSGEENKAIPRIELKKMFLSCTDLLKETPSSNQELTFGELTDMIRMNGLHIVDESKLAKDLWLACSDGSFNMVGLLVSDQNPFTLSVSVFRDGTRNELKYSSDFSGHSIMRELLSVQDYVNSINETAVDMSSFIRQDVKLFDMDSFREAWVNAVVHNTWSLGIPPAVQIFEDRLEVISYGSIPYGQTEEEFFQGVSMPVNEALMQIFRLLGLSEHTGHGIPIITDRYGREAFGLTGANVRVTIPYDARRSSSLRNDEAAEVLSKNEKLILSLLMSEPSLTLEKVSQITGIGASNTRSIVSSLKTRGYLARFGSRKKGTWVVNEEKLS